MIEPSFGIGRIIYCLLEHCYYAREGDEKRAVFGLVPLIAPIKARDVHIMGLTCLCLHDQSKHKICAEACC